ncbi:hypothetical protein L2K70_01635 [Nocardioides KLBMP 9356]|uniref:Uncharacterized protein n=1 Tax=Nocardioides potassii TaxID=2911371 RepID=A0ABS9H771_9ACTN|nr:hypothetical protein [Nocardioides potassii]MCF6376299.1 hypothetical protein [Nocardioides potassii]
MTDSNRTPARAATRRTVVRGAAWTVPAVAAAVSAPAYAASPCPNKTALLPVTWSGTSTPTSQVGTATNGATVTVSAAYTQAGLAPGSLGSGNLSAQTATSVRDSFAIVNNSPATLVSDPATNFQTVTFTFVQPVYGLTFSIDDIDRGTGYWDYVSLTATPTETPSGSYGSPTSITGAGTDANPWRTTSTSGGDNLPSQSVTVTYANGAVGITQVRLKFWSTVQTSTSATHLLRLRQMSFRTCA